MKRAEFRIVESSMSPGKVSMRVLGDGTMGLRGALTAAGFQAGDRVILVERLVWDQMCAECCLDPTQEVLVGNGKGEG